MSPVSAGTTSPIYIAESAIWRRQH